MKACAATGPSANADLCDVSSASSSICSDLSVLEGVRARSEARC